MIRVYAKIMEINTDNIIMRCCLELSPPNLPTRYTYQTRRFKFELLEHLTNLNVGSFVLIQIENGNTTFIEAEDQTELFNQPDLMHEVNPSNMLS